MLNRVQKLLLTEYIDFHDTVLVESSFALVTSKGVGLQAVVLALTEKYLIQAADFFCEDSSPQKTPFIDVEIETLELISLWPLEFLSLKLCARKSRNYLKVYTETGRKLYFEFGEHILRMFYFNIWADRIFNLNKSNKKVLSEPSSGTSITTAIEKETYVLNQADLKWSDSELKFEKPSISRLERRINVLNHSLKAQIQALMHSTRKNDEEQTLLVEPEDVELNEIQSVAKELVEIYKKDSSSNESVQNIWCQ